MHTARKQLSNRCMVCGAKPGDECITAYQSANECNPMDDPAAQLAWAEFAFMAAVHNLREIKPNHYMVVLVEAAIANMIEQGEIEG